MNEYICKKCGKTVYGVTPELEEMQMCPQCYTKTLNKSTNSIIGAFPIPPMEVELGDKVRILAYTGFGGSPGYCGKVGVVILKTLKGAKTWDVCVSDNEVGFAELFLNYSEVEKI